MRVTEGRADVPGQVIPARPGGGGSLCFEKWYAEVWPRLVNFVRMQAGGDLTEAADVAAEAMARAFERWDRDGVREITPWVYAVSLNLLRRRARRRSVEQRLLIGLRTRSAAADPLVPDVDLANAIAGLPPRQRTAIYLRYVADLTQADVARALGIRPGSAASLLHAARGALERRLGATNDGGDHAQP